MSLALNGGQVSMCSMSAALIDVGPSESTPALPISPVALLFRCRLPGQMAPAARSVLLLAACTTSEGVMVEEESRIPCYPRPFGKVSHVHQAQGNLLFRRKGVLR